MKPFFGVKRINRLWVRQVPGGDGRGSSGPDSKHFRLDRWCGLSHNHSDTVHSAATHETPMSGPGCALPKPGRKVWPAPKSSGLEVPPHSRCSLWGPSGDMGMRWTLLWTRPVLGHRAGDSAGREKGHSAQGHRPATVHLFSSTQIKINKHTQKNPTKRTSQALGQELWREMT